MSLKAFHLVFVTVSTLLTFGVAAWAFDNYFSGARLTADLLFGCGSLLCGAALLAYGRYFLRKLKDVSYL